MSLFEEQLKLRKQKDSEYFEDALDGIAGSVMGKRLTDALSQKQIAQSAIEDVLRCYHLKLKSEGVPDEIDTLDEQLEYLLRPHGILRRTVKLEKNWYWDAIGPMLGTRTDDGSAVALIPGKVAGYTFFDSASGKRVHLNRKTAQMIDTEAICFYQPLPLRPLTVKDLIYFMLEQVSVSDLVLYIGMMAVMALLGLLTPLFTKWLFGTVLESGNMSVLAALAGFLFCFTICRTLFSAFQSVINMRVGAKQRIAVQSAVMGRILMLPAKFFKNFSSGELTQRAQYAENLCSILMNSIGTMGLSSVFSLIYIGQVFAFTPALVLPSVLITAVTFVLTVASSLIQTKITKERMLLGSKTSGMTYAMITGVQKIKLAGAEKRMFSRWAGAYSKEASLAYNPPLFLKIHATISLSVSLLGTLILYALAVKSGVSVADYYAFNAAYGTMSGAFLGLAGIALSIADISPSLEMARPILEEVPENMEDREVLTELRGAIEISHVSFRYTEGDPLVIDDLSLKIRPGEYIAIVGATGCGKSTLMRLLLGFETPEKGAIYYDRHDISRVDLKSLRRKIGVVMQDGKLFLGDIFSNIVISAPQLTLKDAWEAAEVASVADDIRAMPMGMNTLISEGQGGISGGQRQRLMIARAVASKPKILMFDEATSALDNVTQKKVSDAIDSLNCTRIVIAHRLSTIRHCSRIIVLDKGKIAESGTYEELIAKNGFFAELVARQRIDV